MITEKLVKLINVKTIITFVVVFVFAYLALTGQLVPEVSMSIVTIVIGFYFGTQTQKRESAQANAINEAYGNVNAKEDFYEENFPFEANLNVEEENI